MHTVEIGAELLLLLLDLHRLQPALIQLKERQHGADALAIERHILLVQIADELLALQLGLVDFDARDLGLQALAIDLGFDLVGLGLRVEERDLGIENIDQDLGRVLGRIERPAGHLVGVREQLALERDGLTKSELEVGLLQLRVLDRLLAREGGALIDRNLVGLGDELDQRPRGQGKPAR